MPWRHIRYDNLSPAVAKVLRGRTRTETARWLAFRSWYGFEAFYCEPGPAGAHEKGGRFDPVRPDLAVAHRNLHPRRPRGPIRLPSLTRWFFYIRAIVNTEMRKRRSPSGGCEGGADVTMTGTEAYEVMRTHHRMLSEQLSTRVAAVSEAVAAGRPHEAAVVSLLTYLAEEVLPHAAAEEVTIYPAAAHDGLIGIVNEMLAEHKTLLAAAEALPGLADGTAAAWQARQIAELFTAHAARENDVLLPALLADTGVDLAALLAQMHHRTEEAARAAPAGDTTARDPQAAVLGLLLEAATALARAGRADLACRLAAAAWAALREDRPELAVTVTAALHGLARRVEAGPAPNGAPGGDRGAGTRPGSPAGEPALDVRDLPPAQRHESIFAAYQALAPGSGFVLINDHDPRPLRYQFEAEHAGQFTWESLETGPEAWRVRIGRPPARPAARGGEAGPGTKSGRDSEGREEGPDLDVRPLAHWKRHDVIFTAYQALQPGAGFVLVNDHDPLPLRYQIEARYPGEFTWDYLETGPEAWRVRIGRAWG